MHCSFPVSGMFVKVSQHSIYINPLNYKNLVKFSKYICYSATKISCVTEMLLMSQLVLIRQFIIRRLQPVNTKLNSQYGLYRFCFVLFCFVLFCFFVFVFVAAAAVVVVHVSKVVLVMPYLS